MAESGIRLVEMSGWLIELGAVSELWILVAMVADSRLWSLVGFSGLIFVFSCASFRHSGL